MKVSTKYYQDIYELKLSSFNTDNQDSLSNEKTNFMSTKLQIYIQMICHPTYTDLQKNHIPSYEKVNNDKKVQIDKLKFDHKPMHMCHH